MKQSLLQVANHMLGRRMSQHKVGSDEDVTIIMDDSSGNDTPHSTEGYEVDTSRHRLLEGNQASDASDYAAAEVEAEKEGKGPARGASLRQSVQADGTIRFGHPSIPGKPGTQKAPLAGLEMTDMLKPDSRASSLGLGVTPSASQQDLTVLQQQQQQQAAAAHQAPGHSNPTRLGAHTGSRQRLATSASAGDLRNTQHQQPTQNGHTGNVLPSPFPGASPFLSSREQDRAVPDPSAPTDASSPDVGHPLDDSLQEPSGRITRWWGKFDAQYMQPVFGGPAPIAPAQSPAHPAAHLHAVIDPHAPAEPGAGG